MEAYLFRPFHRRPLVTLDTCFWTIGWPLALGLDWMALFPTCLAAPYGTYWSTVDFKGLVWTLLDRLSSLGGGQEGVIISLTTPGQAMCTLTILFWNMGGITVALAQSVDMLPFSQGRSGWKEADLRKKYNANSTLKKTESGAKGTWRMTLKWQYKDLVEKARRHFLSSILCRHGGIHSTWWCSLRIQRRGLCSLFLWGVTSLGGLSCFGTYSDFMVFSFPFMVGGWLDDNRRDDLLLVERSE